MMLPAAAAFDLAIAKGAVVLIWDALVSSPADNKTVNYRVRESNGWSTATPQYRTRSRPIKLEREFHFHDF